MFFFQDDYSTGCHPRILEALSRQNLDPQEGYGLDGHCAAAAALIREQLGRPDARVHFLTGGTQTNLIALTAFLRPHESAVAAATGHIATHETGSIEAAGHKVCTVPAPLGKLTPELIRQVADGHPDEHTVSPRLVYLSQSTELGTVYSRRELEEISRLCRQRGLLLYVDGARLSCGLDAAGMTLADLGELCDAFYLGGTKNGALMGEALVVLDPALDSGLRWIMKQRGGMLAKGWLLGLQFEELLRDGLYWQLGRRANEMARELEEGLAARGCSMLHPSPTNQIFPVLSPEAYGRFARLARFRVWEERPDGYRVIRLVTSWSTTQEEVSRFLSALDGVS